MPPPSLARGKVGGRPIRRRSDGGITASAGWTGGGGFRQLRVAPSTWQVEDGDAYLVDGVDPGILSRAVAA